MCIHPSIQSSIYPSIYFFARLFTHPWHIYPNFHLSYFFQSSSARMWCGPVWSLLKLCLYTHLYEVQCRYSRVLKLVWNGLSSIASLVNCQDLWSWVECSRVTFRTVQRYIWLTRLRFIIIAAIRLLLLLLLLLKYDKTTSNNYYHLYYILSNIIFLHIHNYSLSSHCEFAFSSASISILLFFFSSTNQSSVVIDSPSITPVIVSTWSMLLLLLLLLLLLCFDGRPQQLQCVTSLLTYSWFVVGDFKYF